MNRNGFFRNDLYHYQSQFMISSYSVVSISPEVMSGAPVFSGTRVPIKTLLDYLKSGESINDFLYLFTSSGVTIDFLV